MPHLSKPNYAKYIGENKASILDSISNNALKLTVETKLDLFDNTFEASLKEYVQ